MANIWNRNKLDNHGNYGALLLNRKSLLCLAWSFSFGLSKTNICYFQVLSCPFITGHISNNKTTKVMFQVVFEMFWWPWVLHWVNGFKGLLLTLEQLLAAESPLKMMKNAFHFILKLIRYLHFCPAFLSKYTKLKKSVGWTIDKFRLNNSLVING